MPTPNGSVALVLDFSTPLASACIVNRDGLVDRAFAFDSMQRAVTRLVARFPTPPGAGAVITPTGGASSREFDSTDRSLETLRPFESGATVIDRDRAEALGAAIAVDPRVATPTLHLGFGRDVAAIVTGPTEVSTIAHTTLDPVGPMCGCGKRGCIRAHVGHAAMARGRDIMGIDDATADVDGDLAAHLAWRVGADACSLSNYVLRSAARSVVAIVRQHLQSGATVVLHAAEGPFDIVSRVLSEKAPDVVLTRAAADENRRFVGAARLVIAP